MSKYFQKILPHVLMNLQSITPEDTIEGNSLSLFSSSNKCSQFIIEACHEESNEMLVQYVTEFIGQENNWKGTTASLIAFKHMLNSAPKEYCKK